MYGSKCGDSDYYFNTQQFALSDQNKLLNMLKEKRIEATLNRDKIYWRIRLIKSSVPTFKNLVGPMIIPSLQYKL